MRRDDNELLTRTGPGAPMGELFTRYWIPALLADDLPGPDCLPVRVRLLGERLVAFRDTADRIALIDQHCPHRLTASVTRFRAGDRVFGGTGFKFGTHAEYAWASEGRLEMKPATMTRTESTAVMFGGLTAFAFL